MADHLEMKKASWAKFTKTMAESMLDGEFVE